MVGYSYLPQNYLNPYNMNYNMNYSKTPINQTNEPYYGINWVQGEAGARSFQIAPGQQVLLVDSETNIFYIKASDASGMPLPLKKFEYKEIVETAPQATSNSNYITKEEFEQRIAQLESILKERKDGQFNI